MNDFENIQRLIRLKRFEQPEEGFTESFLQQFQQRQRAEMLQKSSVELLLERVTTWWDHLFVPKWSMAAAAAVACATGIWFYSQPAAKPGTEMTVAPAAPEKPFVSKLDLSDLPLTRMAEQEAAKSSEELLRNHVEVRPVLDGKAAPGTPSSLPATGWQAPTQQNAKPAIQAGREGMLGK